MSLGSIDPSSTLRLLSYQTIKYYIRFYRIVQEKSENLAMKGRFGGLIGYFGVKDSFFLDFSGIWGCMSKTDIWSIWGDLGHR